TTHGFRSMFKDWAHEICEPRPPDDVIEMAMAHTIGHGVEAAYRRGDLFEKRRELMDAWGQYCDPTNNVVPLPSPPGGSAPSSAAGPRPCRQIAVALRPATTDPL